MGVTTSANSVWDNRLFNCPDCHSRDVYWVKVITTPPKYAVKCNYCGREVKYFDSEEAAIDGWNGLSSTTKTAQGDADMQVQEIAIDRKMFVDKLLKRLGEQCAIRITLLLDRLVLCQAKNELVECKETTRDLAIYYDIQDWIRSGRMFAKIASETPESTTYVVGEETLLWVDGKDDFCTDLFYAIKYRMGGDFHRCYNDEFIEYVMFNAFERSVWHKDNGTVKAVLD